MKYGQYKRDIEREYGMELKGIMHRICVEEGLNAIEGSKKLGIAKEVFTYWQHHYRFGRSQLLFDRLTNNIKLPGNLK